MIRSILILENKIENTIHKKEINHKITEFIINQLHLKKITNLEF